MSDLHPLLDYHDHDSSHASLHANCGERSLDDESKHPISLKDASEVVHAAIPSILQSMLLSSNDSPAAPGASLMVTVHFEHDSAVSRKRSHQRFQGI